MIKGVLILGAGAAAVGVARFVKAAIQNERQRRRSVHTTHETTRWEGEGGNVTSPGTASAEGTAPG